MKYLLIVGIILFAGGLVYGISSVKPTVALSQSQKDRNTKITSYSIILGFLLILLSGTLYLKRS